MQSESGADRSRSQEKSLFEKGVSYLLFPAFLFGGLYLAYYLMKIGVPASVMAIAVPIIVMLLALLLEFSVPYRKDWLKAHGDVRTDFFHMLVTQVGVPNLMKIVMGALLVASLPWLNQHNPVSIWPVEWPMYAQLILVLLMSEFSRYWLHRLGHEWEPIWRLHATHHSARRLYFFNAGRTHPLDRALFELAILTPVIAVGTPDGVLAMLFVYGAIHGFFQHCNIDVRLGPLNWLFSMAELHRWHHSTRLEQANSNYGNNILFPDIVFGSVYYPKNRHVESVGIQDMDFPGGYLEHLASPFTWRRWFKSTEYSSAGQSADS